MIISRQKKKKKFSRYSVYIWIMRVVFAAIISRLFYIQIYKHDDYKEKADTQATRFVSEKAPRGIIYDSKGNILASNKQTYAMTYTTTPEADGSFFKTIDSALALLSENKEGIEDDLILKLDGNSEPYFQFKSTTESAKKAEEIRFKRDRGLNEKVEKDLNFDSKKNDLTDDQINLVNEKLIEITPKEVFYYLVKSYNLINLIDPEPKDVKSKEYKQYRERAEEYKEMDEEELTNLLLKNYSYSQLRTYMVVKDALKMESFKGYNYKTVTLASNIEKNTAFIIKQKLNDLPGVDVKSVPVRFYPYNDLAASILGYISPIDNLSKEKYELRGYDISTDLIGVAGIESAFEDELKGVKGGTTVKVNSEGRTTEELFQLQSYPGNNVHLTIDKNIQYAAEKSLVDTMEHIRTDSDKGYPGANRGAAVAVEVKTGRILASVSYPSFNPNKFTISGGLTDQETEKWFSPDLDKFGTDYISSRGLSKSLDELFPKVDGVRTDPYDLYPKPFYNYAHLGLLPPGSIFKPLTAIAGLQEGVVGPTEMVYDKGKYDIHPEVYGDSFGPKCYEFSLGQQAHGNIDVTRALEESCNFYFYDVAYRLYNKGGQNIPALDSIAKYAWRFGLGVDPNSKEKASTGIELEESYGQVYNFQSYKNRAIDSSKFILRDFLESGSYSGNGSKFIPFDYSDNEYDSEKLRAAKTSLKGKITEILKKIGTNDEVKSTTVFEKDIMEDIKTIMNTSDKYKENVKKYEESDKGKFNIDSQSKLVVQAISKYVVYDRASEIKSPGEQVYSAIGQGMNAFTPMQLVQYISTLANGGTRYKLHYVDKITDPDGNLIQEYKPEVIDKIDIKPEVRNAVVEGMEKVNNDDGGTAKVTWEGFPINTAGKTGTADAKDDQEDYGRKPYATYISFAPADSPEIAVVAVAYDGAHGSYVAPVAKAIYEAYFKEKLQKEHPDYVAKSDSFQKYALGTP
ncbi:penicillin-binding transpeptidase domain-containing protein [Clostridium sp. SHJSY1]|uniref:penicillin-binding transpeptidase domain-containing protein n=1 Tax=Clostridium sp. SHJSY1 TaxID=2942483 RepID=UPI002876EE84|nr:penicillin-binding transpeptidase domain-containing protein [Clostridium sp. SHJSY1]MDS0528016.1 penicillin-binding transpeptidase domain-containing protein [Clostridium sp. SHJSY1]